METAIPIAKGNSFNTTLRCLSMVRHIRVLPPFFCPIGRGCTHRHQNRITLTGTMDMDVNRGEKVKDHILIDVLDTKCIHIQCVDVWSHTIVVTSHSHCDEVVVMISYKSIPMCKSNVTIAMYWMYFSKSVEYSMKTCRDFVTVMHSSCR